MHTGIHYCQCANLSTIRQIRVDFSQVFINDPQKSEVELLRTGSNYYLGWALAKYQAYYFNRMCRCVFTHVVFIIPPPAGHPCPLSALEHAMSSLSAPQLKRDLKDSYTRFRTVG